MPNININKISTNQKTKLLETLKERFIKNKSRHSRLVWEDILKKLESPMAEEKLWSLNEMEITGGEPDVTAYDKTTNEYVFIDCSKESPIERRNLCYDQAALDKRKEHKPKGSAVEMAKEMGIEILTEDEYRELQKLGEFDTKTSSWIQTPSNIRDLGGALFCDRRFNTVFAYHNGAESYYSSRGFRGKLKA